MGERGMMTTLSALAASHLSYRHSKSGRLANDATSVASEGSRLEAIGAALLGAALAAVVPAWWWLGCPGIKQACD
jgi:hypothetical protein